jgi:hypothetical protein
MTTRTTPNQGDKPTATVGWAYPSSPRAVELGHGKTGTYYLTIGKHAAPQETLAQAVNEAKAQGVDLSADTIKWIGQLAESIVRLAQ